MSSGDHVRSLCLCLPPCNRASTVQKALPLLNRVLKEPTVHVQLSVMGLSVPLVAEASTAAVWDSRNLLETAESASTVEREPSLEYENSVSLFFKRAC